MFSQLRRRTGEGNGTINIRGTFTTTYLNKNHIPDFPFSWESRSVERLLEYLANMMERISTVFPKNLHLSNHNQAKNGSFFIREAIPETSTKIGGMERWL